MPHAIHVTTANVTDRAGALAMFDQRRDGLSQVQNVLVDGGYTGKPFATAVQGLLGASVEVVKRSELHTFVVLPKRWVVERSFAWLEKCRRLWKNCERKLNTSLQMVVLAFMVLILKDCKQALRIHWKCSSTRSNPVAVLNARNVRGKDLAYPGLPADGWSARGGAVGGNGFSFPLARAAGRRRE